MVKYFRARRLITRPHHLPVITAPISVLAAAVPPTTELVAQGRPTGSEPRRRPEAWAIAFALHALVIALFLITWRPRPLDLSPNPPGVSVVFDKGGQPQAAAPAAPQRAPSATAQSPPPNTLPLPPAPVPPPPTPTLPQTAEEQPEVNLNLPEETPPQVPLSPQPAPLPPPKPRQRAALRPRPSQRYLVMNNMSLGGGPTAPPNAFHKGLNLDLPQSAAPSNSPQVTVQGDVGADWNAELDRWVDEHKYYPEAAAEQGQQGDVEIHFVVDRHGNVTGLRLTDSSGSPFLDQAWLGLFSGAQLPAFPAGTKLDKVPVDATMHFELIR